MLLLPSFHGEGFGVGLFIGVRGVSVLLVQLASFSSKPACSFPLILQCAGIHCRVRFVWAARLTRAVSTSFRSFWRGFWSLLRTEGASAKMTTLELVWDRLCLISIEAFYAIHFGILHISIYTVVDCCTPH